MPRGLAGAETPNIVMQKTDYSCGAAALATICKYYWGDNVDEDLFLRSLDGILTERRSSTGSRTAWR